MSYILDALRKAETERAMTRVSSIASPPVKDASFGRYSTRRILLVVIAMACAMALTWWWTMHAITAQAQTSPPVTPVEPVAVYESSKLPLSMDGGTSVAIPNPMPNTRSTPRPARVPPSVVEAEDPVTRETEVSTPGNETKGNETKPKSAAPATHAVAPERSVDRKMSEPVATSALQAAQSPSVAPEAEAAIKESVAMMTSEVAADEPPAQAVHAPAPASSPAPAVSVHGEATAQEPAEEDMELPPLLRTLPYRFQSTLPKMVINAQAYTEEADARFVIINMKKYREGDHTEADIVVERIGESYLVMSYQGQVFRLQR